MAHLDFPKFQHYLRALQFEPLLVDVLGWNRAPQARGWQHGQAGGMAYGYRAIAELAGVRVLQVVADGGWPGDPQRMAIWRQVAAGCHENLLIFTDQADAPAQSLWYWVKRGKGAETGQPKFTPRHLAYFRGQPADGFASKFQAMVAELSELDASVRLPVLEAARRMERALDTGQTTKRYLREYEEQHRSLCAAIEGIACERERRWYASVILNRLMFVWFLQKKGFLGDCDANYLPNQLDRSRQRGKNRFFGEFLHALFFQAFAKPPQERGAAAQALTGKVPYLNGGLFLHHKLELDEQRQPRLGITLKIPDSAFEGIFALFGRYTWRLDDAPCGSAGEINPDVLGCVFEKYINQKAFGAYYTRPEITSYLADRCIHARVLERIRQPAAPGLHQEETGFACVPDMLATMDDRTALRLVQEVLPSISVLDPAVGSGAFLVAALKSLSDIYHAVAGRAELGASDELRRWLAQIRQDHPSAGYAIKKRIVTGNLYGVDVMEEACEIAKLRLFLTMAASIRDAHELEPLPNIDFSILPGNALIGLVHVDERAFDHKQHDLFKPPLRQLLEEKNRELKNYRNAQERFGKNFDLRGLRESIDARMSHAAGVMNELLRDRFEAQGVKFEQATWDAGKGGPGKVKKRKITRADIDALHPLHWGYSFDEIMQNRGGFDIILTNPPWEIFKPQAKEFFAAHSELVTKNRMTIQEFDKERARLLQSRGMRQAWLDYESRFPHVSAWFRTAPEYAHQSAVVHGKKTGSDINLYKLFLERCFHLLRAGGHCGIVIPGGICTDLGATGLRDLLLTQTRIQGLFGLENRKTIFEGVDRRFKFVVLTFEKSASAPPGELPAPACAQAPSTQKFPAAFMRLDVAELDRFPGENALWLDAGLIRRLSPGSHSLMEFKSERDIAIAQKLLGHPLLGEHAEGAWHVGFTREFDMTGDSSLFKTAPAKGRLPLYEGKMIWQFDAAHEKPRYWVDEKQGRAALTGQNQDRGQEMDYQTFRLGFRDIASNTNERTLIACMIAPAFHGNKLPTVRIFDGSGRRLIDARTQLVLCALWNSFVLDWVIRLKVTATLNFFYLYQLPVPRLTAAHPMFAPLCQRAARLICTTPQFDALAREGGLRDHRDAASNPAERARLRAELDGLVAHLYGLGDDEFLHILGTFPLVAALVKTAARDAYRDVARGLIQ